MRQLFLPVDCILRNRICLNAIVSFLSAAVHL